ncbi:hypothetical protein QX204_13555 [Nocardia sp. PE-7]|uniref:hypothetical protein n=1 Tax=Nocardia sp. PE-7 TaxID=3058426 RepID=UPI00265AD298|nr:hypothetical protein [Nocardia sp. PE-7]WKG12430.1 hypothetical protein QX204_13555 [Nocardia sp. PE-7]
MSTNASRDVRALLGMDTRAAGALAGLFFVAESALALTSWQYMEQRWPVVAALVIVGAAMIALLRVGDDPIPVLTTVALAVSIPVTTLLTLTNMSLPQTTSAQLWTFGSGTVTATFMCVRGRTFAAWCGMLAAIGTTAVWSARTGQGAVHGVSISIINLGPLLMATFFAYTLRPAAHAIFQLRAESTKQAGAEAAAAALLAERLAQADRLDHLVRPLLQTLAGPAPVTPATAEECSLVEAYLRDTLRAPALSAGEVIVAARDARRRGVEVILVDDHGLDDADSVIHTRLLTAVTDALATFDSGSVHIRILPPHRPILATIVANHPRTGICRTEFDRTGYPVPAVAD